MRRDVAKLKFILIVILAAAMLLAPALLGQTDSTHITNVPSTTSSAIPPAPPTNVILSDAPNDNGHGIRVDWTLSADDLGGNQNVVLYEVFRADKPDAPDSIWEKRGEAFKGISGYTDRGDRDEGASAYFPKDTDFYYKVAAVALDGRSMSAVAGPGRAEDNWFNRTRIPTLIFSIIFIALTMWFINAAKKGLHLYIRPLAGIEAIDEAIGRATEMGRPILYVLGLGTAADIATIASFTVLGRVARRVAEFQTSILVPCYDPIVMTVAQETVKAGYADAGRPDSYDEDSVYFVTQAQFAYVAAVNGTMLREKPATNLYLGKFYAESLLLAETGVLSGSIQISGTDEIAQLPFFVVACDYTLIGEELYAASAYLGREPLLLGTLKAQDWFKGVVIAALLTGLAIRLIFGADIVRKFFEIG
jgi:hypothetical protein